MTPSIVTRLRDLVPLRPLTAIEAVVIAELQATKFLELTGTTAPPVSEKLITELPRLQVERTLVGLGSGATQWSRGRWLMLINSTEIRTRQRYTIAHELKHIVDSPFARLIYPETSEMRLRYNRIEAYCDHFAACLLMPRPWIKAAWADGQQSERDLATRFDVSRQAMALRLRLLGLIDARPRCDYQSMHREYTDAATEIAA
jgi:Zn-dependent peptidase ImmA (M78 family)